MSGHCFSLSEVGCPEPVVGSVPHTDCGTCDTCSGDDSSSTWSGDQFSSDSSQCCAEANPDKASLLEEVLATDGLFHATVKNSFIHIAPLRADWRQRSHSWPRLN